MGRFGSQWLGVALASATISSTSAAGAGSAGCDDRIRIEGDVSARWMEAIQRACAELSEVPGTDPTARVRIAPVDRDLAVEVTLADGRFAARRLRSPDKLRATLEALLLVPPSAAPGADVETVRSPPGATGEIWPRPDDAIPPPAAPLEPTVGIELGGGTGGRLAGKGYVSFAPAGFVEIRVGAWLFGTSIRWDVLTWKSAPLVSTFEMETVAAGLFVGRRLPLGFGSVDLGVSPRLVAETQTYENRMGEQSDGRADVRLGGFGRLALGRSALRGLIELDAELSPSRLRRSAQLDPSLPTLPSWSAGLVGGVMWRASP